MAPVEVQSPAPVARQWSLRSGRRWRPLLASIGLLALLLDQNYAAPPLIVGLAAVYMPGRTSIRRLTMTIPCLVGLNAVVLTVLAVASVPVNARLLAAAYLVVGGALPAPAVFAQRERGGVTSSADTWALGTALAIFAVFYRPFFGASLGERLALLSYSTDAANHLSFVQENLLQSGYVSQLNYPQAWAGNVALTIDLLIGKNASASSFISVAALLIVAMYAMLVFFAVILVLETLRSYTGRTHPLAAGFAVVGVATSATLGSTSVLLMSASYTQSLAITALLAIGCLLVTETDRNWALSAIVGLLSIALMQTWYLLAPVLAALLLVYLATIGRRAGLFLLVASPLAGIAAYPIVTGPTAGHLSAVGGTRFTSASVTYLLLFLTVAGIIVLTMQKASGGGSPFVLLLLVVTSLILTAVVVAVQSSAGQAFGYYAIKLLLAVFLFGTLAGATAVAVAVDRTITRHTQDRPQAPPGLACVCVVGLLFGGGLVAAIGTLKISLPYASGSTPRDLDGRVLDAIFAAHPTGLDPATDAWVVDSCSRRRDHIANKWIHDIFLTWNASRRATNSLYFATQPDRVDSVEMLVTRAADPTLLQRMEVYVHRDCWPDSVKRLAETPKITVIRVP